MNIIDQSVYLFFPSVYNPFLTFSFYTFTWFFNTVPALCLFFIVSSFLYKWSGKKSLIEFWGALSFSYVLVSSIKMWFDTARPELGLITAYGPSFPSAHTALATTFFLFFLRFMRHEKNIFRRYIHVLFCTLTPFTVGMSRLYLGVHWLSDVLAGFVIGGVGLVVSDYIWKKLHTHTSSKA